MTAIKGYPPVQVQPHLVNVWFASKNARVTPANALWFRNFGSSLGVDWLGLYCMAIIETGYFTSEIFKEKNNLFGIGAVDSNAFPGAIHFDSVLHGIEAGSQHLAVYAGVETVRTWGVKKFVAERTYNLIGWGFFGIVSEFRDFGGKNADGKVKWASNPQHGAQIEALYAEIVHYCMKSEKKPEPAPEPVPPKSDGWKALLALVLKVAWPIVTKFFPWLGWLTVAVYAIIEFLSK